MDTFFCRVTRIKDIIFMIKKLNLTDFVVLVFLLLSGIIILFGKAKTEYFPLLIGSRIAAIAIVFTFIKVNSVFNNKITLFLRHFYPLLLTIYFYGETGYYNNIFFNDLDAFFVQLEQAVFGCQPALMFSLNCNSLWFNELMFFSYFSYYFIVFVFPIIVYIKKRNEFERVFFIIIFSFYFYYLFFVIFPVVGPQFYFPTEQAEIAHPGIFGKLVKLFQEMGETPTGAFPSSHVALAWIILLISTRTYKKLIVVIFPLALLICFSTVYIKAHYVVDVIGGIISAPILYFLGDRFYMFYSKRVNIG